VKTEIRCPEPPGYLAGVADPYSTPLLSFVAAVSVIIMDMVELNDFDDCITVKIECCLHYVLQDLSL
jgi:hypothetical protein